MACSEKVNKNLTFNKILKYNNKTHLKIQKSSLNYINVWKYNWKYKTSKKILWSFAVLIVKSVMIDRL